MMAEETAPDPGGAFWATMPDRVYQSVQKCQSNKKNFGLARLFDRMDIPLWTGAAATVATVLIVSWFIVTPLQNKTEMPQTQGYEFAGETAASGSVSVSDLDNDELSTIDSWAGSELASIAQEAETVFGNGRDIDIYEALEALNASEINQLSKMLEQIRREG